MRHISRNLTAVALFLALLGFAMPVSGARAMRDPLQGKWKVKVFPDDDAHKAGQKEYDDTFEFKADKFISETMKKKGFADAVYEEDTRSFGPAQFKAESKSEKEGTAKWTGTVTATEMTGDLTWTKKDGTELRFSIKGSRAP